MVMEDNRQTYLIIYDNDFIYETFSDSVKSALVSFCFYTSGETSSTLLEKALVGFNEQDIKNMIELYSKISNGFYTIVSIYQVEKKLYNNI